MTKINPYTIVKQAGLSPALTTLLGIGAGGGIGYLLNKFDEFSGNPPEVSWRKPLLGAIFGGMPFWLYGMARNSWDYDSTGKHTMSLWDRWTSDDDTFWKNPVPTKNWKDYQEWQRQFYKPENQKPYNPDNESKKENKDMEKRNEWVTNIGHIPVNAFNETTWVDASRGRTPMEAAGFVTNTLNQTGRRVGSNFVTPGQVINTMVNAGIGYGTAWLAGKTLGAMAGVSPETQKKLCEIGTWGGMLGGISNAANHY